MDPNLDFFGSKPISSLKLSLRPILITAGPCAFRERKERSGRKKKEGRACVSWTRVKKRAKESNAPQVEE